VVFGRIALFGLHNTFRLFFEKGQKKVIMKSLLLIMGFAAVHSAVGGVGPYNAVSYLMPNREPAKGYEKYNVTGIVQMVQQSYRENIKIYVQAKGLEPNTYHGFHIHTFGDTVTKGCQSTGSHFNPYHRLHGGPTDKERHVGDLGNVIADGDGVVNVVIEDPLVKLDSEFSVYGRAFVLHAKRDDLGRGKAAARNESLRTGNAGARLACGVIINAPVHVKGFEQMIGSGMAGSGEMGSGVEE